MSGWAAPNFGALCTVAGTTVLGIHSGSTQKSVGKHTGYTKSFFRIHRIHSKTSFGIRTGINTDFDMQYRGTNTSRRKKNVSCRPREQGIAPIAQKNFGTNLTNEISPPKFHPAEISPRPPLYYNTMNPVHSDGMACSIAHTHDSE